MKKVFLIALTMLMMLALFAVIAAAEGQEIVANVAEVAETVEPVASNGLPAEPFTWAALGTIAGCTAFALLFVQLIKAPLDKIWKVPTRAVVYVVCLIVMLLSAVFSGDGMTWNTALLAVVNAVIPTLAAMGAYEITFGRKNK